MNKLPNESLNEERPDALDCILLEDALIPSSGFAASVMEAIEEQASQPASIPFPWKLAMPGLAALLIVIVIAIRLLAAGLHSQATLNLDSALVRTVGKPAGSVVLALAAAFVCFLLTQRLAAGRPIR
jgi:hypothetical protein